MSNSKLPGTLAIIPARGGSKGLPRKNVRMLGGMPLIAHTIHAARKSCIERTIVSTDDKEIMEVAAEFGAEVPFQRPPEFSGDQATSLSVLQHALSFMEEKCNYHPEHIIFLQPTSPFRNNKHIDDAIEEHLSSKKNSLLSVTEVQEYHPYFMFKKNEHDSLEPLYQMENRPLRRQDLPEFYRINGAIYISKRKYYNQLHPSEAIFDWNSLTAYIMDAPSSVDINDYLDFQKAELMLEKEKEQWNEKE